MMAHKSYAGTVKNGRDSISKRLGLKKNNNQYCKKGQIIIRQRGLKVLPGNNIGRAKDFTLYALKNGILNFKTIFLPNKSKYYKKIFIIINNWEKIINIFYYNNFKKFKII